METPQELLKFLQFNFNQLTPGDARFWTFYSELPGICKKIFGSKSQGAGWLERSAYDQWVTLLLDPSQSILMKTIYSSQNERIYYEMNLDILPLSVQNILKKGNLNDLSPVFYQRLIVKNDMKSISLTMAEYFFFYFIYFPMFSLQSSQKDHSSLKSKVPLTPVSPMQRSQSLLHGFDKEKKEKSFTLEKAWAPKSVFQTIYPKLFKSFLEFFLKGNQIGNSFDVEDNLKVFFFSLLNEFWLSQNQFESLPNNQIKMNSPIMQLNADIFSLISIYENHLLEVEVYFYQQQRSPDQLLLSINQPLENSMYLSAMSPGSQLPISHNILNEFRIKFYKFLKVYMSSESSDLEFDYSVQLWKNWIHVEGVSDWKSFIYLNYPFYSSLLESFLNRFITKLNFNHLFASLSREDLIKSAPILAASLLQELNQLLELTMIFNDQVLEYLKALENSLIAVDSHYTMFSSPMQSNETAVLKTNYQLYHYPNSVPYVPVFNQQDELNSCALKLLKKLEQLLLAQDIWLDKCLQYEKQPNKTRSSFSISAIFKGYDQEFASPSEIAHKKEQIMAEKQILERLALFCQSLLNNDLLHSVSSLFSQMKQQFIESLDEKSQQQKNNFQPGLRKIRNIDLEPVDEPQDLKRIKRNEIGFLVHLLVPFGIYITDKWSNDFLKPIEAQLNIELPKFLHQIKWEKYFRQLAVINNLLFFSLIAFFYFIISKLFSK